MNSHTDEKAKILDFVKSRNDITSVQAAITDLNGTLRGKRMPIEALPKILDGKMRLPLSSANVDIWGEDIESSKLVFVTGDQDGCCHWTGRAQYPITWLEKDTLLLPLWLARENGQPFFGDARRVLANVLELYQQSGLQPQVATELEFYLTEKSESDDIVLPPRAPRTGERLGSDSVYSVSELEQFDVFLDDIYDVCKLQNIPLDSAIAENGAGQFEINFHYTGDVLKAADDTVFFKRLVKGLARKHGFIASFMAKPFALSAGSGMHVHTSMLDAQGNNVFDDGSEAGSRVMHSAVAGIIQSMADSTLLFAPHLNSYRRLSPRTHAPTRISWGYENRTAAIRIPAGPAQARRIEHRVSGSDANPYLVVAAILAACLHGVKNNLEPQPPVTGDAYKSDSDSIPATWQAALQLFKTSRSINDLLSDEFAVLYADTKEQEIERFNSVVTPYELTTYLESV